MLDKYNPRSYLPASVETNPNKKLVSGQRYEEILYYKDVAPYGPTYHLITTVAELFWSAGRSNRFLTLMILAYLRGLHGHSYNWAKAILHGLGTKILFLQSRARSNESGKTIFVIWAPCFVHILFSLRRTLFTGTQLEEAEGWVGWTHVTKDTDMSLAQLHSKYPTLIILLDDLRQRCKLPEEIPIASLEHKRGSKTDQPGSTKRPHAEDIERGLPSTKKVINFHLLPFVEAAFQRHSAATDMWKKSYEDQLSKVRELQATNDGLREQLAAKDAEKSDVHALARTEVQHELEEFKRSLTEKEKAAEEIHLQKLAQVQIELDEYKRSSEASIKRLDKEASHLQEALAAKESAVQALVDAHQKEISTLKATCRKYKTTLDGEIGTNANLHNQVQNLKDELNASKYTQE
ncbi:hypothetical protein R1flu_027854 [Riccia fluitans]|uniref:Uncharacterized protein n=1 Tax=Riccia fluitans TaxID=41844 RepID=A0ABD1XMY9_9MARC